MSPLSTTKSGSWVRMRLSAAIATRDRSGAAAVNCTSDSAAKLQSASIVPSASIRRSASGASAAGVAISLGTSTSRSSRTNEPLYWRAAAVSIRRTLSTRTGYSTPLAGRFIENFVHSVPVA